MAVSEVLPALEELFAAHGRPARFANAEHCCECEEHARILASLDRETVRAQDLRHAAWDPLCAATPEAFLYFFPALARLAATGRGDAFFLDRFCFHLRARVDLFTKQELTLVKRLVWALVEAYQDELDLLEWTIHDLDGCLRALEERLGAEEG